MPTIRTLRRGLGLTFVELALETGIPARTLCQIEHGLVPLAPDLRARLAEFLGLPPESLLVRDLHTRDGKSTNRPHEGPRRLAEALLVTLTGALLLAPPFPNSPPVVVARDAAPAFQVRPAAQPAQLPPSSPELATAMAALPNRAGAGISPSATPIPPTETALPTETPPPTVTPTPAFRLEADGPHGCPLAGATGQIVITQGYDVGTHAPAAIWGGIDLAVDVNGDGAADPGAVSGTTIVATRGGTARVFLGSWPGGNYVRVEDSETGWSTAYAHLASVAVADGQALTDGAPIGQAGATGYATGPHLHYEVWHSGQNVDPTGLVTCGLEDKG